jgi:hypothetical protein
VWHLRRLKGVRDGLKCVVRYRKEGVANNSVDFDNSWMVNRKQWRESGLLALLPACL